MSSINNLVDSVAAGAAEECALSLIVPCYNVESFVSSCLDSIFHQLTPGHVRAVEVIVINDGSKDDTLDIIRAMQEKYKHVQSVLIDQENAGLSGARNAGLRVAKGRYIGFVDGDDVLLDGYFDALLPVAQANSFDIIEFDAIRFSENVQNVVCKSIYEKYFRNFQGEGLGRKKLGVFKIGGWYVWSRWYKRALLKDFCFAEGRLYEDIAFTPFVYLKAESIHSIDRPCYGYRINPHSITYNVGIPHITSIEKTLVEIKNALNQSPLLMKILLINVVSLYHGMWSKNKKITSDEYERCKNFYFKFINEWGEVLSDPRVGLGLYWQIHRSRYRVRRLRV